MAERPAIAVTVRYFAAARAAAGTTEEVFSLADPATVSDVLVEIVAGHGRRLADVLGGCSYLLREIAVHSSSEPVADGDVLDVLPPFAGG